jgi:hypothetical protein
MVVGFIPAASAWPAAVLFEIRLDVNGPRDEGRWHRRDG